MGKVAMLLSRCVLCLGAISSFGAGLHTLANRALTNQVRRADSPNETPRKEDLTPGWHRPGIIWDFTHANGRHEQIKFVGKDNILHRKQLVDGSWEEDWSALDQPLAKFVETLTAEGGTAHPLPDGDPDAIYVQPGGDGHLERFKLHNSVLFHQWEDGDHKWNTWRPIGNRQLTQFVVGRDPNGESHVFGVGKDDKAIWSIHQTILEKNPPPGDEGGWSRWESWGGSDAVRVGWSSYGGRPVFEYVNSSGTHYYKARKEPLSLDFLSPEWGAFTPDPPHRPAEIGPLPPGSPKPEDLDFPLMHSKRLSDGLRKPSELQTEAEQEAERSFELEAGAP